MRNYIERAKDFIKQVYPYICECIHPWETGDRISEFNAEFNRKVVVKSGLARIALITSDYVVKYNYDPEEVRYIGGCENEMEIYAEAEREGVASLFAKITEFVYNGRHFYIMPRVRGIGSKKWYAEHYMTEDERLFCRKHRITDLHEYNYGFVRGHVCLVDYACHTSSNSAYSCYYDCQTRPESST